MSIITRIKSAIGLEERSVLGVNGWPVPLSASAVTPATAQGVSAVYACVQAIAETTASLPLILFKRNGDDRERASDHPLYRVLHDQANPEQTALEAREYMQACVLLRGNAFARLVRGWDGQVPGAFMKAGDLDQRVTVERYTSTEDELGQPIQSWAPLFTCWAAVEPLVGREYLAAQAAVSEVTARVTMRYRTGITAQDRVIHDGKTYGIVSVIDVRSQGRELVLMCRG